MSTTSQSLRRVAAVSVKLTSRTGTTSSSSNCKLILVLREVDLDLSSEDVAGIPEEIRVRWRLQVSAYRSALRAGSNPGLARSAPPTTVHRTVLPRSTEEAKMNNR